MTILKKVTEIQNMIGQGKLLEAFEQFYHNDVVMQEAGDAPRVGKDINREYEKSFVANIKEVHGAGVDSITSDDASNTTAVESWMDLTFQDGNRMKFEQVAVQKWSDGQIISEKFYHK